MKKYFLWSVLLLLLLLALGSCSEEHTHSYSDLFTSNDERHWRDSLCGHGTADDGEHTFDGGLPISPASCQNEGSMRYACTVCGHTKVEAIPPLAHELEHFAAKTPLCNEAGWEEYDACKNCAYSTKTERYDHNAHSFAATENRMESTCQYQGYQEYACTNCRTSKSEKLPKATCSYAYDQGPFTHVMQCQYCHKQQGESGRHTLDIHNVCTECNYQLSCEGMEFELSENGEYYILKNGGDVRHRYPSDNGYLAVPPYYNQLPVKVIGDRALSKTYARSVGSVYIFDHVEEIGKNAFTDTLMGQLYLPATLKRIGEDAFESGHHISNSPATVTVYFGGTLADWLNLDLASLDSNPMKGRGVGSLLLENGPSLAHLVIPEGTKEIKPFLFAGCRSIREITLPEGLLKIGESAFDFSTPSVTFSNMSYLYRTAYHEIVIPDSVQTIGKNAFCAASLLSVTLGRDLTAVGTSAFGGCYNLVELNNRSSLSTQALLGDAVYKKSLLALNTDKPQESRFHTDEHGFVFYEAEDGLYLVYLEDRSGVSFNEVTLPDAYGEHESYAVHTYALYQRDFKKLTIPDCVSHIGEKAFVSCPRLVELTVGDGVTEIGDYAFFNCGTTAYDAQMRVTLGARVERLGDGAFYGCYYLTSFEMPDTVKTIGEKCFHFCSQMKSLRLSAALESIGDRAFNNCAQLEGLILPAGVAVPQNCFAYCRLKWLVFEGTPAELCVDPNWSSDGALQIYLSCEAVPDAWGTDWNTGNFPVHLAGTWSLVDGVPIASE